jgi:hypothetical protein
MRRAGFAHTLHHETDGFLGTLHIRFAGVLSGLFGIEAVPSTVRVPARVDDEATCQIRIELARAALGELAPQVPRPA